ncbi:hypothetical protein ABK040_011220 [Willaertia magna]
MPLSLRNKLKSQDNNNKPKTPTGKTTRFNKKVSSLSSSFPHISVEERELRKNIIKLPSDVLLKILEYYGGKFDQYCGTNVKKFIKLYFGKFTKTVQQDSTPKFIFRKLQLTGNFYYKSELLKLMQSLSANSLTFAMEYPFTRILEDNFTLTHNNNRFENTDLKMKRLSLSQTRKVLKALPMNNITSLHIDNRPNKISQESLRLTLQTMANNLTKLSLTQNTYKNSMYEFKVFIKDIKFPKLKIFEYIGYSMFSKEVNEVLNESEEQEMIDFSLNTPSLTTLNIQTNIFSVFRFSKAIKNWTNLESLKSHVIDWHSDSTSKSTQSEFFENLENTKLNYLSLSFRERIYSEMLKFLLNIPLKSLELTFWVGGTDYSHDFSQLLSIKSLRRLELKVFGRNKMFDSPIEINCDNLEELFIENSLKLPVDCFIRFKNLKCLTICKQNINDEFVESISTQLPFLKYIDVSYNHGITNDGIIALVKNCKRLKAIRAFGCGAFGRGLDLQSLRKEFSRCNMTFPKRNKPKINVLF